MHTLYTMDSDPGQSGLPGRLMRVMQHHNIMSMTFLDGVITHLRPTMTSYSRANTVYFLKLLRVSYRAADKKCTR